MTVQNPLPVSTYMPESTARLIVPGRDRLTTRRWRLTAGNLFLPDLGLLAFQTGELYVSATHAYVGLSADGKPRYEDIYLLDSLEVHGLVGVEPNIDILISKLADAKTARQATLTADPAEDPDRRRGRLARTCLDGLVLISAKAGVRALVDAYLNCRVVAGLSG